MPVQAHEYDELKLRLERGDGGDFRVLASSSNGETSGRFALPFSDLELENFILRVSRAPRGRRRMESSEMHEAKRFGGRLFESLFQQRVRDLYHSAFAAADREGRGLRITLYLTDVPELMHLPWEYLYDDPNFLAISAWTPVVRYLDLPRPRRPLEVESPLRVLAMVSSPADAVALDVEREKANLEQALEPLVRAGAIELHWLEQATLSALLRELRREEYHIFHYIGHGAYDAGADDGLLLLEDEEERGRAVSGSQLGTILHDCTTLRLAVLNACEGARTARDDPFAGVAASLVQRDIPAVIAMQFEITDDAAIVFAEGFYEAVAAGFPVDAALAEARKAIFAGNNDIEWGTPVLFMRVSDGRIFDVTTTDVPVVAAPRLALSLSADPPQCIAGESVTWRLEARNEGAAPLLDIGVLDGEGRPLEAPFDLEGHAERALTWSSRPRAALDQVVTAGARSAHGERVTAQATGHVDVREPPPPPPPTLPVLPVLPVPGPDVRARPIAGEVVAGVSALVLLVSMALTWVAATPGAAAQSGWSAARYPWLIVAAVVLVLALALWRATGGAKRWATAAGLGIAVAGLVVADRMVLVGPGAAAGRSLAIAAAGGIAYGGWLALAADAGRAGPGRPPRGELLATAGGLVVIGSLWLSWSGANGWKSFALTDIALALLAGVAVLVGPTRLAAGRRLGGSGATAAVLVLLGIVLAGRVVAGYDLKAGRSIPLRDVDWSTGRYAALAGACVVIAGGLLSLAGRGARGRPG